MHSLHINASGPAASLTSGSSLQQNEQALFAGSDFSEFRLVTRVVHHAIAKLSSISSSVSNAIEYAAVVSEAALWRCPALNRLFHNSVNSPWTLSNVLSDLSIISNWEVFVKLSTDYNIRGQVSFVEIKLQDWANLIMNFTKLTWPLFHLMILGLEMCPKATCNIQVAM